jgi:hypothetical protein
MLAGAAAYTQTAKYRAEKSANTKSKWADPEHRRNRQARMKQNAARPEVRERLVAMLAVTTNDPAFSANASKRMKSEWDDPNARARRVGNMKAAARIPGARDAVIAGGKAAWDDPVRKAARIKKIAASLNKWKWLVGGIEYGSCNEVAAALGISPSAVRLREKDGRIQKVRRQADHENF